MSRALVRTHHQVTIPEDIRKKVHVEVGDPVDISISENGEIIIKPLKTIDPSQSWFWSKEWQESERDAEKAITNKEVIGPFTTAKDAIKALKKNKQ
ncbi:MAG: AbrB/MazE/SpoVT family DNA-binding domain-containing protein [Elusimicrobiota bacterium]